MVGVVGVAHESVGICRGEFMICRHGAVVVDGVLWYNTVLYVHTHFQQTFAKKYFTWDALHRNTTRKQETTCPLISKYANVFCVPRKKTREHRKYLVLKMNLDGNTIAY